MPNTRLTQEAVEVVVEPNPPTRLTQEAVEVVVDTTTIQTTQAPVEAVVLVAPEAQVSQAPVEVVMASLGWKANATSSFTQNHFIVGQSAWAVSGVASLTAYSFTEQFTGINRQASSTAVFTPEYKGFWTTPLALGTFTARPAVTLIANSATTFTAAAQPATPVFNTAFAGSGSFAVSAFQTKFAAWTRGGVASMTVGTAFRVHYGRWEVDA